MDQFPGNSKRPIRPEREREEPKKVERVVQGEVVRRKTPLGRRMTQNLIGGDAQSVWGYMFGEVLIPAARDMIADALTGGIERAIFGDGAISRGRGRGRGAASRTDYHGISSGRSRGSLRDEPRGREISKRSRSSHNFDEIILEHRVEAEEVLDRLDAMLDKYDSVTVADFYELCGVSGNYTDQKYGWTTLAGCTPQRVRGGYLLRMTPPEPLDSWPADQRSVAQS
jgi:hypothetical protein